MAFPALPSTLGERPRRGGRVAWSKCHMRRFPWPPEAAFSRHNRNAGMAVDKDLSDGMCITGSHWKCSAKTLSSMAPPQLFACSGSRTFSNGPSQQHGTVERITTPVKKQTHCRNALLHTCDRQAWAKTQEAEAKPTLDQKKREHCLQDPIAVICLGWTTSFEAHGAADNCTRHKIRGVFMPSCIRLRQESLAWACFL